MHVPRQREAEVPLVLGAVDGLGQRPQHEHLEHPAVVPFPQAIQGLTQHRRIKPPPRQANPGVGERLPYPLVPFSRRPFVHPIQSGDSVLFDKRRRAHVGGDHGFLDEPVGVRADEGVNGRNVISGKLQRRLVSVEIQRPALISGHPQGAERPLQVGKRPADLGLHVQRAGIQEFLYPLVGEPLPGADNRFVELETRDVARVRNLHVANHGKPGLSRFQRAEPVGYRFRQHRHHPVGQVNRVAPLQRLRVQRTFRLHVVSNIGDRDDQTPPAATPGGVYRIVEIPRGLTIDGHQRQTGQVAPIRMTGRNHRLGQPLGGTEHRRRPLSGHTVAGKHGFRGVGGAAAIRNERLDISHQSTSILIDDAHRDGVAVVAKSRRIDQGDAPLVVRAQGVDIGMSPAPVELADDRFRRVLDNAQDTGDVAVRPLTDLHLDDVARSEANPAARLQGNLAHAQPAAVQSHDTPFHASGLLELVAPIGYLHHLAGADEPTQHAAKLPAAGCRVADGGRHQLPPGERTPAAAQGFPDIAGGDLGGTVRLFRSRRHRLTRSGALQ